MRLAKAAWLFAAVIGPAVVFGAATWYAVRIEPWAPSDLVARIDRELAASPVGAVVVGPSFARTDIDSEALEDGLGLDPPRVVTLAKKGAVAPVWYSILKYRVFDAGHRPRLVVLVATMQMILSLRPESSALADVTEHFAEPDETLRTLTFDATRPAWVDRALGRRKRVHQALTDPFRLGLVRLLPRPGDVGAAELANAAGDRVFGEQHAAARFQILGGRVEAGPDAPTLGGAQADTAEQSYLPALAKLVQDNGARLVIVFPPTAARDGVGQYRAPEVEADIAAVATKLGVGWLDLRHLSYPAEAYADGRHMTAATARTFSAEVAARIVAMGGTRDGGDVRLRPLLEPTKVERTLHGAPPEVGIVTPGAQPCVETVVLADAAPVAEDALVRLRGVHHSPIEVLQEGQVLPQVRTRQALGRPCSGTVWHHDGRIEVHRAAADGPSVEVRLAPGLPVQEGGGREAWWMWPGTALRWTFDEAPDDPAAELRVEVEVEPVDPRGDPPILRVGDHEVELRPDAGRLVASLDVPRPTGPWAVELDSPSGAAFAEVARLVWTQGNQRGEIVVPPGASWVDLLPGAHVDATPVPAPTATTVHQEGGLAWVDAPWPNRSGCSPARVFRDGTAVPRALRDRFWGTEPLTDGLIHLKSRLWFPVGSGEVRVGLDSDRLCWSRACRACGERMWVYPGDTVAAHIATETRQAADLRLRTLRVQAVSASGKAPSDPVRVRVLVDGVARVAADVPASELAGAKEFPVTPPLVGDHQAELVVELTSPTANPALLFHVWGGAD